MVGLTEWLKQSRPEAEPAPRPKRRQSGWYKVRGMAVHLKGQDLPPPCVHCRGISSIECDFPLEEGGGTCSAPLCAECAKEAGPDLHLCPLHVRVVQNRRGSLL